MTGHDLPLVSICIPARNAERWIAGALESALAQDHPRLEVVVVDDASTDATAEIASDFVSRGVAVHRNPARLGHSANWNRAVELSRGEHVKFLSADDELSPDCVSAMSAVMAEAPNVGMVFSRRELVLAFAPTAAEEEWKRAHADLHRAYGALERVNDGMELFHRHLAAGLWGNWIGEPTNVMMRRDVFVRAGGFSPRVVQAADLNLWTRAQVIADVGFVDRELCRYRILPTSLTADNRTLRANWLDRLWILDGLVRFEDLAQRCPELSRLRAREERRLLRRAAVHLPGVATPLGRRRLWQLVAYLRHRLRAPDVSPSASVR